MAGTTTRLYDVLVGRSLMQCAVSVETGCDVGATARNGDITTNPDPSRPLPADANLVVITMRRRSDTSSNALEHRRRSPDDVAATLRRRHPSVGVDAPEVFTGRLRNVGKRASPAAGICQFTVDDR